MKNFFLCLLVLGYSFYSQGQATVQAIWQTDSVLRVPESVKWNPKTKVLYVANIEGQPWAKDGKGSISVLSPSGKIMESEWVKDLNAPKGMTLYKQDLYVADMNELVQIDIKEGSVIEKHAIPGAEGLNDVTVTDKGKFFITDSRGKKLYTWMNGRSEVYLEGLKGPNGVLFHKGQLYLLDAGGLYRVTDTKEKVLIAEGMEGGTDGIEAINDNNFLVSCWSGTLWLVQTNGTKQLLLDTRADKINCADIGYDPEQKKVFVPTFFKNQITAYQLLGW